MVFHDHLTEQFKKIHPISKENCKLISSNNLKKEFEFLIEGHKQYFTSQKTPVNFRYSLL